MKKIVNALAVLILLLFLSPLILILVSPLIREDTTQIAKDEFSKYYNGRNSVVLRIDCSLYFEEYTMNINKLEIKGEENGGLMIESDKLIFSTSKENAPFDFSLYIYECDLDGENLSCIFEKDGYKTHPWGYALEKTFYIEHYFSSLESKSKQIDTYNVAKKEYKNIAQGKDCSLSDYIMEETSNYECDILEDKSAKSEYFTIKDKLTKEEKIVDDDFLSSTIYIESMEKFKFGPKRVDISRGHILLTYSIGAGDGWNYPHLIFEYNFEEEILEYKCLVFPYGNIGVDIFYIEKQIVG